MMFSSARIGAATVLLATTLLAGCSTSLTNMSPARTFKPGEVQGSVGYQIDLHSNAVTQTIDAGKRAKEVVEGTPEGETISEETLRALVDTALVWKLFTPGGAPEGQVRAGVYDGLLGGIDMGFRFNGSVYKGDVRLQLWSSPNEAWAVTAQAGYGYHKSLTPSWVEWMTLSEWKRSDLDFSVAIGYEYRDFIKVYVAPRLITSKISAEPKLGDYLRARLPEQVRDYEPGEIFPENRLYYYGMNWGTMLGYKYVFLHVDVSLLRLHFEPIVLGSQRDYSGWAFAPTVGLTFMWR